MEQSSSNGLLLLEHLAQELKKGNKTFKVEFPLSRESTEKVNALEAQGRDFFRSNKKMEDEVSKAMSKELETNPELLAEKDGMSRLLGVGAEAARDLVAERLQGGGGGDVSMKALKSSTIKNKGNSKIGVDSGALLADVKKCKPRVK